MNRRSTSKRRGRRCGEGMGHSRIHKTWIDLNEPSLTFQLLVFSITEVGPSFGLLVPKSQPSGLNSNPGEYFFLVSLFFAKGALGEVGSCSFDNPRRRLMPQIPSEYPC